MKGVLGAKNLDICIFSYCLFTEWSTFFGGLNFRDLLIKMSLDKEARGTEI